MRNIHILVINPGSTSTKIAVYEDVRCIFLKTLRHSKEELEQYKTVTEQYEFRKNAILEELKADRIDLNSMSAVIGRGGLTYPLESGVYEINERMVEHCKIGISGMHASNLGSMIAYELAKEIPNSLALTADPVVTDEMNDIARVSGHPNFERRSIFHALNQKAVARQHAAKLGRLYSDMNLIVVHLGGGVSIGAHNNGRVVDANNALDGEGPFSPERSGTLPAGQLVDMCFSNKYTKEEIKRMITGEGGFVAYLGTNDARDVEMAVNEGDERAIFYHNALAYQVSKAIGEMATVLKGRVDGILITGGMAYDKTLMSLIRERVDFISQVYIYPGQDEMKALAMNALNVARGEAKVRVYSR
ncbi:butyrate kinase [Prolixibacter sp. SD074]|uniref:butyrate kinase n=1 Tax=Prolixibacter sp. SD074 TaxID=2652391 RepID=UPI00128729F9|nr:butyrate kinase [Prolixibacter sp. SD074]GET28349.1 putative butyrate kinase [Prolixibacter sp. SD074]